MPEKNAFTLLALMDIVNITTDSCSLTVPERANFVVGIDQVYWFGLFLAYFIPQS